jgi:hypothetical protein
MEESMEQVVPRAQALLLMASKLLNSPFLNIFTVKELYLELFV